MAASALGPLGCCPGRDPAGRLGPGRLGDGRAGVGRGRAAGRRLAGEVGQVALGVGPDPPDGDAEDGLAVGEDVHDLLARVAGVDAVAVRHEGDVAERLAARLLAQVADGVADLAQGHPGVQQPLDDPQLDHVGEAVQPLGARSVRRPHRRRDQAGPGPVVELPIGDADQLDDGGAAEARLRARRGRARGHPVPPCRILRNYNDVTSSVGVREGPVNEACSPLSTCDLSTSTGGGNSAPNYSKSSGLTWSRNSRNFSTSRSSSSLLMRMDASLSTSSSAKMGVLARTARALVFNDTATTENLEPFWRSSMVA